MPQNFNFRIYDTNNLFLSFSGPFCPISHKFLLKSFAGARRFTVGLFYFGYLPDSGANDPRLCLTHERVLEGAVGDSGFKGTLRVARNLPGVENWLHDSVDVFDSFPTVCFGLFYE